MQMKRKAITILLLLLLLTALSACAAEPTGTSDPEKGSDPPSFEQVDTEDKNVQIARELLTEADEVRERMSQGMTLLYTGEHQTIDGRDCFIFALGTDHDGQFVREYLYGVCDNLIYTYDALSDIWKVLGTE